MATFEFTAEFLSSFHSLPVDTQKFIKEKLFFYSQQENVYTWARKLKGYSDIYLLRCGEYRAVFQKKGSTFLFLLVKHRKDVYRDL